MKTRNITLKRSHRFTGIAALAVVVLSSLTLSTNLTIAISDDQGESNVTAATQIEYQKEQEENLVLIKANSHQQAKRIATAQAAQAAKKAAEQAAASAAATAAKNKAAITTTATTTAVSRPTATQTANTNTVATPQNTPVTSGLNLFGQHFAIAGTFTATANNKVVPADGVYRWSFLPSVILVDAGNAGAHNAVVQLSVGSPVVIDGQQLTVTSISGEAWSSLNSNIANTVARMQQHRAVIQTCLSSGSDPYIRHIFLD
ncbi:hypothetical protein [Lapidilactobacillus luobeiensis]|uniref:hypothetical protein n=1 Tax=Lapidilactobacillus luobeiensis TaxID=2950371 RepID=UPI0021C43BFF|nr:hypothetical protein [Lapidilactobacillus luobeiensis]